MRRSLLLASVVAASQIAGCGFVVVHAAKTAYGEFTKDERDIDNALDRYRVSLLHGDLDKAADLFDPSAELSHESQTPVVGRAAIREFLTSFKNYKVIEYELTASSTSAAAGKGSQKGTYRQKVVAPDGKLIEASGSFSAEWTQQSGGAWLIRRLNTSSGTP